MLHFGFFVPNFQRKQLNQKSKTGMNIYIYLKFNSTLQFAINDDNPSKFKEMKEDSWVGFDNGDTLIWKISQNPGTLQKIKIRNVKKKDQVKIGKGTWKDTWTVKPKKVTDSEYTGQPNAAGATVDNPYAFAYDIDYMIAGSNGWQTLDPGGWSPPPPPEG